MPLSLSPNQLQDIAARIQPDFHRLVQAFDLSKYPQSVYLNFVSRFASPSAVKKADVSDALRWKFGHWKKLNYPAAHKDLIDRVSSKWTILTQPELSDPNVLFDALNNDFRFITASFLTHLVHPTTIAIIDQHNFRSLGHFVSRVIPNWRHKAAPSNFQDLLDVSYFLTSLAKSKALTLNGATASLRDVDMFLMAHGKSIKPRRSSTA